MVSCDLNSNRTSLVTGFFPPYDPEFEVKVEDISQHYLSAPIRAIAGERTISIDEMTGRSAIERALKSLPMRPGKVECREARIYSPWYPNLDC
jgi:hypothetical protein